MLPTTIYFNALLKIASLTANNYRNKQYVNADEAKLFPYLSKLSITYQKERKHMIANNESKYFNPSKYSLKPSRHPTDRIFHR